MIKENNIYNAVILLIAGFIITAVFFGIRSTFGVISTPASISLGASLTAMSFTFALQNLMWGFFQPFAGALADIKGARNVLLMGVVIYTAGLVIMGLGDSYFFYNLGGGFFIGLAMSFVGFPIIISAIMRSTPPDKTSIFAGIATAGGSFGQFIMSPLTQFLISNFGWVNAVLMLAFIAILSGILAFTFVLEKRYPPQSLSYDTNSIDNISWQKMLRIAVINPSYLYLTAGFFVCGFQVAFIAMHLPVFTNELGFSPEVGAFSISLIGLANIAGCIIAGKLGQIYSPIYPLSLLYFLRSVSIIIFISLPITIPTIYTFAFVMGLLWLGTVPLTSGVIGRIFGPKYVGMLYGVVFLSHQIGSFTGVFFGGYFRDITGTYDMIWWISIAAGIFATIIHLPIKDKKITLQII